MFERIKRITQKIKARFQGNNLDNVIWLIDIVPSQAGFSILQDNIFVPYWILLVTLIVYVYLVGTVEYLKKYGQGAGDCIKGYINMLLLLLVFNISYWFIKKRSLLRNTLKMVKQNDDLSTETTTLLQRHEKLIAVIKKIVLIFYALNTCNCLFIYLPNLLNLTNNPYSIMPCVGLEPLTAFPRRQACLAILITEHICTVSLLLGYQAILLVLIAHTTAMYHLLSEDVMFETEDMDNTDEIVNERLFVLIRRHAPILETVNSIKVLYSLPLGIDFGTNAVSILIFFCIPLQDWVQYIPVLTYCFVVFFLYCFLCQKLINAAEDFEKKIYICGWEKFNVQEQKLVYVMLMLAQKPISLLAADIVPVNIYTFAKTLQGIYKFVTAIKL